MHRIKRMVLGLFALLCFFPANGSAKHQFANQSMPALNDADTKSFLASTATFIMECDVPMLGASALAVRDLCWLDDNIMVLTRSTGKQVLKVFVHRDSRSCSYQVVDSGYHAEIVSCSPDGNEFYVTDLTNRYVRVYDKNCVNTVIWKPLGLTDRPNTVALNDKLVAVGLFTRSHLYVYDRQRDYKYQVMIEKNRFRFFSTHLTMKGQFLFVTGKHEGARRLVIHDLNDHTTITVGHGSPPDPFNDPTDICSVGDFILVTDKLNHIVAVYTVKGKFIHNLRISGTFLKYPYRIDFEPGNQILAVHSDNGNANKIQMFSLSP